MSTAVMFKKQQPVIDAQAWVEAAESGDTKTIKALLAAGADVNAATPPGETALMGASAYGHIDIVRILLDQGADINAHRADGFTALMSAAFFGRSDVVRTLVAGGADMNVRALGMTARQWATSRGFTELAALLKHSDEAAGIHGATTDQPSERSAFELSGSRPPALTGAQLDEPVDVAGSLTPAAPIETKADLPAASHTVRRSLKIAPEPFVLRGAHLYRQPAAARIVAPGSDDRAAANKAFEGDETTIVPVKRVFDGERWRKRSDAIRERLRAGVLQNARAALVFLSSPAQQERDFDRGRRWHRTGSEENLWRLAAIVAVVMLVVSGGAVYILINDTKRPPLSPYYPLPGVYTANPVIAVPLVSKQSEHIIRPRSSSKIPIIAPNPLRQTNIVSRGRDVMKRSDATGAPPSARGADRRRSEAPGVVSLAPQDETEGAPRVEKKLVLPSSKNDDERQGVIKSRRTQSRDAVTPEPVSLPVSSPPPAASPKKKVIQWP